MANLITVTELTEITGIDVSDTSISEISTKITNAQDEIFRRTSRTILATDSDILTVQRAIAFLSSYYIRRKRKEMSMAKLDLNDYYRELKEFHGDITPDTRKAWRPKISVITNENLSE